MTNPEWGGKHTCQHCGVKYYDLNRSPIVCPKCGTQFNPDALLRSRRSKPVPPEKPAAPKVAATALSAEAQEAEAVETKDLDTGETDDDVDVLGVDDEKDKLIEDVSELGEDENDMAEALVEGVKPDDT